MTAPASLYQMEMQRRGLALPKAQGCPRKPLTMVVTVPKVEKAPKAKKLRQVRIADGGNDEQEQLRAGARARLHACWLVFADQFTTDQAFFGGRAPGALADTLRAPTPARAPTTPPDLALALLGFNLGVELAQVTVAAGAVAAVAAVAEVFSLASIVSLLVAMMVVPASLMSTVKIEPEVWAVVKEARTSVTVKA